MNLKELIHMERLFDSNQVHLIKEQEWSFPHWRTLYHLICAFKAKNWTEVFYLTEQILHVDGSTYQKGFALQFAVSASEIIFDENQREKCLGWWSLIPNWAETPWCIYCKSYHHALTLFFRGELYGAQTWFRKALQYARDINYDRGKVRCLFHLGLIELEQGHTDVAYKLLENTRHLAKANNSIRWVKRTQEILNQRFDSLLLDQELTIYFKKSDFKSLRHRIVQRIKCRKNEHRQRNSDSTYLVMGLWCYGVKKHRSYKKVLANIADPLSKIHFLRMKEQYFGLSQSEKSELKRSMELYTYPAFNPLAATDLVSNAVLCNLKPDVSKFLNALVDHPSGLSKKELCQLIWDTHYQPHKHDQKIHKLAMRARQSTPLGERIQNTYGGYRLTERPSLASP